MSRGVERAEFERLRTDNLLNKRLLIDLPKGGLEPPRVTSHAPQTCASASSATSAKLGHYSQSCVEDEIRINPSTDYTDYADFKKRCVICSVQVKLPELST